MTISSKERHVWLAAMGPLLVNNSMRFSGILLVFCSFMALGTPSVTASQTTFQSALPLKVYARGAAGLPDRLLGKTPARRPISVPKNQLWYVQPIGELSDATVKRLAADLRRQRVPGLDLSDHWELTDSAIAPLSTLPALQLLNLTRTAVGDRGLLALAPLPSLQILSLGEHTTDAGAKALTHFPELRDLVLDQTAITGNGLRALARLRKLERLDLSGTHVDDAAIKTLQTLPKLKSVVLGGLITDAAAPALAKLPALEELDFAQTEMTAVGLLALGKAPRLRILIVNRSFTDEGLQALRHFSGLKSLDLSRSRITDSGLQFLSQLSALEELALTETAVTDAGLRSLADLPRLRLLELSDTQVTSHGVLPMAQSKTLVALSLPGKNLNREDIENLSRLASVRTILVDGVVLPDPVIRQIHALAAMFRPSNPKTNIAPSAPDVAMVPRTTPLSRSTPAVAVSPMPIKVSPAPGPAPAHPTTSPRSASHAEPPAGPSRPIMAPVAASAQPATVTNTLRDRGTLTSRPPLPLNKPTAPDVTGASATPAAADYAAGQRADGILQAIAVHAKTARRAPAPSLAGLRSLTQPSFGDVISAESKPAVDVFEEKPETFIGNIEVNSR